MRIALLGTRGVPARYGGFETAVEEIGSRLAARGNDVIVYCRDSRAPDDEYMGMRRVHLPAVRSRSAETLTHTAMSCIDLRRHALDCAIVFNSANAPLLPLLRARRVPVAVHVDGLEWQRAKWGPVGRRYYRLAESLAVRWADQLIADAAGIQDYYRATFGAATALIPYGAPLLDDDNASKLSSLGLRSGAYHLLVARMEPENHVDVMIEGYLASNAQHPLAVVGSVPYPSDYSRRVEALASNSPRVQLLGGVWDQQLLDQLYRHAATYLHGHSVGGTNPSLLRAVGAETPVIAYDVIFNREVLRGDGCYASTSSDVANLLDDSEKDPVTWKARARRARVQVAARYDWDSVTDRYESLCRELTTGAARRGRASGRRVGVWDARSALPTPQSDDEAVKTRLVVERTLPRDQDSLRPTSG